MPKTGRPNIVVASALLACVPVIAFGGGTFVTVGPVGDAVVASNGKSDRVVAAPWIDSEVTSAVGDKVALLPEGGLAGWNGAPKLKAGLLALSSGDAAAATRVRSDLKEGSLDWRILTWAMAMEGSLSSGEIDALRKSMPDWPGQSTMARNAERALAREIRDPKEIVNAFSGRTLETIQGKLALASAFLEFGDEAAARNLVVPLWRNETLDAKLESRILAEFDALLTVADHRFRMERMLYAERAQAAWRVSKRADAAELAKAWTAVMRGESARKLLEAVPEAQRDAGYAFAVAKQLRRQKKYSEAAKVILKAPRDPVALVSPDDWWNDRRMLSRELLDRGDVKTAYRLAAEHSGQTPLIIADAEFHAGWYALRGLADPALAATHFERIVKVAEGPITTARAYYWLGRGAEAGGPGDAKALYDKAAAYPTTFYGQLASVKIGKAIAFDNPVPTKADRAAFAEREPVRAIRRIEAAGDTKRAGLLFRELAQQLQSPGELALLVEMAETRGEHQTALRIGKLAAARGIDVGTLSHPVGAIPASAAIETAGKALAYAIARQESEFNVAAVSGAGALGLLQLLPGTAKEFAKKTGLPYSKDRLTTDAGYNATLGASFLGEQLSRFAGSYVLTFVGYNAGPSRAKDWVKRYGDPRGQDLDTVVDWIERIPFAETRSYVQRVMENYQVYKLQLSGKFDIAEDLVKGR